MADIKNVEQVALEAGNSPDLIFQPYRELVTAETAEEWFGVTPAVVAAEAEHLKTEGATGSVQRAVDRWVTGCAAGA